MKKTVVWSVAINFPIVLDFDAFWKLQYLQVWDASYKF